MNTVLANGPEQVVTLRRLKWLGAILVLSNLFLGALSVYLLRTQDSNYSRLIADSVPLMNDVRRLQRTEGIAFRRVIEARVAVDAASRDQLCADARRAMAEAEHIRVTITAAPLLANSPEVVAAFTSAVAHFGQAAERGMAASDSLGLGPDDAAQIRALSRASDGLSAGVQQLADRVEAQASTLNGDYSAQTRSHSAFVLGIAGWPVLLAAAVVALTVAVVVVMLFVFRQADAGAEGP